MTIPEERRKDAIVIMKKIYDLSERNVRLQITIEQIHNGLHAWDISLIREVVWYWVQKKYVKPIGNNPDKVRLFYITAAGIDYVEGLPK